MNILVTGSEGNIGKKLIPYLREKGHTVIRNDIVSGIGPDYYQGDISGNDLYYQDFNDIDVVFHLAAMVSRVTCEITSSLAIHTNICGTNNVCKLCNEIDAFLINFSTSEVYGNTLDKMTPESICFPNNRYALSKYMAEQIVNYEVKYNGLKAVNVRPFMIYDEDENLGAHRSAMIRFAEALLKKKKVVVHKGAMRGWLHISNAVEILEKIAYTAITGTINIGNPDVVPVEFIAKLMCMYLELKPEEYITYLNLPEQMTLEKNPDLTIQKSLGNISFLEIEKGVKRVLENVRKRI